MGTKRVGLARMQALIENLKRELQLNNSTVTGNKTKVISVTGTRTLTKEESGSVLYWTKGSAHNITLPACEAGLHYTIYIKVGSNNAHNIVAASGDAFFGQVTVLDNNDDKLATQSVTYATATGAPDDHDHLLLDGDSNVTGSGAGAKIELTAIDGAAWLVHARLLTTGTPSSIATISAG